MVFTFSEQMDTTLTVAQFIGGTTFLPLLVSSPRFHPKFSSDLREDKMGC